MKFLSINISIILLTISCLYGQKSIKQHVDDGDKYMTQGKYYAAKDEYKTAFLFDTLNVEIAYKYAISLQQSLNFCEAKRWYSYVIHLTDTFHNKQCLYNLAMVEKNCGDYSIALEHLIFLKNSSKKYSFINEYIENIDHEIKSLTFAINHQNDSIFYHIEHLPAPINTENSEFNPVIISGDRLVYSSYSPIFKDTFESIFSQIYTSKILHSELTQSGWKVPENFSSKINSNKWFTANICFANNYSKVYFTRCYDSDGQVGKCSIYSSQKRNGKWSKPDKLPTEINFPNSSSTQPFVASAKEYDLLFFASDRDGGYGKLDIWYSIIKDNKFSPPSNLGSIINTKGNEITPSYDSKNSTLYFSSDWHEGFGGFDIFSSKGGLNDWSMPNNMGIPINSENNDLYYYSFNDGSEAYFSSNRIGSYHAEGNSNCCGDIYYISSVKKLESIPPQDTVSLLVNTTEEHIKELLPLNLYFDNDMPNPKSIDDSTSLDYKDLLNSYFDKKVEYEINYSNGLVGDDKKNAVDTIDNFFNDFVGAGYRDIELLASMLKLELAERKNVKIKVKGFASPLNTSEYNYHLSKRRISSLYNFLYNYENGYFKKYFDHTSLNGGSLTIFQDARGDKFASSYVSDNPNDKRNSIYSKSAALERRIQIVMYSSSDETVIMEELPKLSFNSSIYNAGEIVGNENKTGVIDFINDGKSELIIKSYESDCQCVQLEIPQRNIAPQAEGKIYFLIKAKDLKDGKNIVNLKIFSNSLESTILKITFEKQKTP